MREQIIGAPKRMFEEPAWVADHDVWNKAKSAADKNKQPGDYYALVTHIYKKMGGKVKGKAKQSSAAVTVSQFPDEVGQMLTDNPDMSAATFLNLLKSKGYTVVTTSNPTGKTAGNDGVAGVTNPTEADSSSSNAGATRPGVASATSKKEAKEISFRSVRIIESAKSDNGIGPVKFRAILIQEGLGNLKDGFYYSKESLQSAVPVFEGKKIYADHPASDEESVRPERSVRDILGYFENVKLEEDTDGRSFLSADVQMLDEQPYSWARGLMRYAVDYSKKFPDKDFVGLSINASGDAEEIPLEDFLKENEIPESVKVKLDTAQQGGMENIRVVSTITDAISCDLVTEAGAGGKVLSLIEKEKSMAKSKKVQEAEEKEMKKESEEKKEAEGHDDAEKDKELIKDQMKKHLGDDMDEADEAMMQNAMACAQEMGMEQAMQMAASYVKMAKHMAKKEAEAQESTEKKESEEKKCESEAESEEKKEANVESLKSTIAKLNGEVAALKESSRIGTLKEYLDSKLKETKLSRAATDKIRESLGPIEKVRDEKQIDKEIKSFVEGWNAARGESGLSFADLVVTAEKAPGAPSGDALSFADCVH